MPNHFKLSNTLLMSIRYISNRFVAMMTFTILDTQIRIQFWQGEWIPGHFSGYNLFDDECST